MRPPAVAHRFWRVDGMPHLEVRDVLDGRQVCYAKHAHETFSFGVVTGGTSSYLNEKQRCVIDEGTVVLMNPGDVHACNPERDAAWSYRMFYLDTAWLQQQQIDLGVARGDQYRRFEAILTHDPVIRTHINALFDAMTAQQADTFTCEHHLAVLCETLHERLGVGKGQGRRRGPAPYGVQRVARQLEEAGTAISLETLAHDAGMSASQLIRQFKQHFGMTPHAYLLNSRVQYAQRQLRRGAPLAQVAVDAGFADQAHFQRTFKQHLAATPGQYRAHVTSR
ncbi:AraC family transcriptional regulator [Pseudomonas sp. Marseille-QA0892]